MAFLLSHKLELDKLGFFLYLSPLLLPSPYLMHFYLLRSFYEPSSLCLIHVSYYFASPIISV